MGDKIVTIFTILVMIGLIAIASLFAQSLNNSQSEQQSNYLSQNKVLIDNKQTNDITMTGEQLNSSIKYIVRENASQQSYGIDRYYDMNIKFNGVTYTPDTFNTLNFNNSVTYKIAYDINTIIIT